MKITQNQERYQLRLIKMTHEVLSDRDMQNILAKITDDDSGRTNYLVWGYGDSEDKASIGRMLVFLIDDILDGRGERVTIK